jgi:thioredoxin-related protein
MRFLILLMLIAFQSRAGDSTRLYHPEANVEKDMAGVLARARAEKKHVLIQVGGNWCVYCYRLNSTIMMDSVLRQIMENNFVVYHLNYSKENKNLAYLKKLGFPQRFGFPVMVVLDAAGNRLHTQDGSQLMKMNGYDRDRIKSFFINWAPAALNEVYYKD